MAAEREGHVTGDGSYGPSTKTTQKRATYTLWTPERVARMQRYPEATASELAAILGVTESAVRHARARYGRYPASMGTVCAVCDERPVWFESRAARALRLCKGCWLREKARRLEEEREETRLRQKALRLRRSKAR